MGFAKRDHATGLQGHDGHMHVVAQVVRIDKARCSPDTVRVGHDVGRDVLLVQHQRIGMIEPLDRLVSLADPMKPRDRAAVVLQRPSSPCRDIGVAALAHRMAFTCDGQGESTLDHKKHALRLRVQLRPLRAAAGLYFHDILRESFGKTAKRAGDDPEPGALPEREERRHDIAHGAAREYGISLGENRTVGQQGLLIRVAAGGREIAGGGHSFSPSGWA